MFEKNSFGHLEYQLIISYSYF